MSAGPEPKTSEVAPPPVPADVGIVAALPIEVAPFQARFRNIRKHTGPRFTVVEAECGGKIVALVVAGVGAKSARRGAEVLLLGHRPRWLVSTGFAGALSPELGRNDVVLATRVRTEQPGDPVLDLGLDLEETPEGRAHVRSGTLLTVDRIIRTAGEKTELHQNLQADLVDMESYPIANLCAERAVRFLAVRVISDEAAVDLPPEVLSIVGPSGSFRLGAALAALWKRPGSIKDLWSLRDHAHEAAQRLGTVLEQVVRRLP